MSLLFTSKFSSGRLFKNQLDFNWIIFHILRQKPWKPKRKQTKPYNTILIQFQLFIFYETRLFTENCHGRLLSIRVFWRQIRNLETQDVSYFSLFAMWYGFENCKSPFVNIKYNSQWEKLCEISMPFLSKYIDVRTVKFFPPAESWLVNSNFPRASRMQG